MKHFLVDASTGRPFAGNPVAICVLDGERDLGWMQLVPAERDLSEPAPTADLAAAAELLKLQLLSQASWHSAILNVLYDKNLILSNSPGDYNRFDLTIDVCKQRVVRCREADRRLTFHSCLATTEVQIDASVRSACRPGGLDRLLGLLD